MAPAQEVERGKTDFKAVQPSAQSGPDPLPDSWGEWLTRNGKGRVRVIGGLEANSLHHDEKLIGAITPFLGESVGSAAVAPLKTDMETNKISSDAVAVSDMAGRSQEIRDLMSEHIAVGTVCPNSDDIFSEARNLMRP